MGRVRVVVGLVVALLASGTLVAIGPAAGGPPTLRHGSTYAEITPTAIVLGNSVVERRWSRAAFATTVLLDKRGPGGVRTVGAHRDFTLRVAAASIGSERLRANDVVAERIDGGLRLRVTLTSTLGGIPGLEIERLIEVYDGIAGFRSQTVLTPAVPLALSGYTLEEVATGPVAPTLHAFRSGADWREPDYTGPPVTVGDPHAGTWRQTTTAPSGTALAGAAQWASAVRDDGRRVFAVAERVDLPSTRAAYDGTTLALDVDLSRDVASLGPFEEQIHVENPVPVAGAGRPRLLPAGRPTALEAAFTGVARDGDDEPWQHARYLQERRTLPYGRGLVFNSNGTDADRISTGAKDDMDIETIRAVAPIARSLGVETFVLDDGWQAISGDWYPDSPQHPEPRWDGTAGSKFAPRFPDDTFAAVREAIAPMELGLWMSPMHFHNESATFAAHPEWACAPAGHALAGYNALQPEEGSNEAGIGTWGPAAIPHVERRIRTAITEWGVGYFKFDFLVWLDCAGQGDLYGYRDAFVAMLDRLRVDHPDVTFQIDETNDYRLFPFESVSRGPTWFQNGTPTPDRLLHNLWNLSPYVPTHALGQHVLGGKQWERYPVDTLLAAALPSHATLFSDLRGLPESVVAAAAPWVAFQREHASLLGGMAYPLLTDPLSGGWTALQPWDPSRQQGSLLAFRQSSSSATQRIALRGVDRQRTFDLIEAPTGALHATVTGAQLADGIDVTIDAVDGAKVLLVRPVATPAVAGSALAPAAGEWLAGDLHVHSCFSHGAYCGPDDDNTAVEEAYTLGAPVGERFAEAAARGLDFLAITDHNDVRSSGDPGFGSFGVVGVPGYEASYDGHAQVLGARRVLDPGARSAADIDRVASEVRALGGVFQINHPAESSTDAFSSCERTDVLDWRYGYDVVPDTIEVWNIGHHYQPPFPSASSNHDAIRYWECWLDRGARVAATGGSDSHWLALSLAQGPGSPTTWVHGAGRSATGVLGGLRAGRTSVAFAPPALGGAPLLLEGDVDGDGSFEAMVGDTVPGGTVLRVRGGGAGGLVDVRANGTDLVRGAALAPGGAVTFRAPPGRGWVRATLSVPDAAAERALACEPSLGGQTTYCRNPVTVLALTSPIYVR